MYARISLRLAALSLALGTLAPLTVAAQQLPAAEQIIARYRTAVGGEAFNRYESYRITGAFAMPAAGIEGTMELLAAKPNRALIKQSIPGIGEMMQGYDGQVGWTVDPMQGPRLQEGAELERAKEQMEWGATIQQSSNVASRETVERTEMAGQSCLLVKTTWKSGRITRECYSGETGLLVASMQTMESPMGSMDVTSFSEEYREFGGVKMATRLRQQMGPQEIVLTITDVQWNAAPASAFERPAAVETLVQQKKAGS